mmetsp:Transcript_1123/g.2566  ORF Transcript_1123/g.2566 Transcript_1123/m.2566 type:complete len:292 (-) Transcript_1123:2-877(-)
MSSQTISSFTACGSSSASAHALSFSSLSSVFFNLFHLSVRFNHTSLYWYSPSRFTTSHGVPCDVSTSSCAPAAIRTRSVCALAYPEAMCTGVNPMLSLASTSAPKWIKSMHAGASPTPAMKWSGVRPFWSSMFGLAPIWSASSIFVTLADWVPASNSSSAGEAGGFFSAPVATSAPPSDSAGGVFVRTLIATLASTGGSATADATVDASAVAASLGFLILIFTLLDKAAGSTSEQTSGRERSSDAQPPCGGPTAPQPQQRGSACVAMRSACDSAADAASQKMSLIVRAREV